MDSAGTPSFMAPEVCSGEAHDGRLADCYALGATMYCIRIGRPPFIGRGATKNQKLVDLHNQIKHKALTFPIQLSPDLKDLVSGLMMKNPRRRLPLSEALNHTWLQQRPIEESME
jgi:serine/threonine protein kinase